MDKTKHDELIIKHNMGWISFNLREIWEYRDLLFFLVLKDIKVRYKQTVLGIAWAVLQPLLAMILFTVIFGNLAKVPSDGIPYPLFAYSGLVLWNYFSSSLSNSGNSLVANSSLITKVYFPRLIIPASASVSGLLDLIVSSSILGGMLLYYHVSPSVLLFTLSPLLLIMVCMVSIGFGLWLSALNVEYRDFQFVIPFFTQFWMFATPVIYPSSLLPDRYLWIMYLNPMCGFIETFRTSTIGHRPIQWELFAVSLSTAVLIFFTGLLYFKKVERSFADVI